MKHFTIIATMIFISLSSQGQVVANNYRYGVKCEGYPMLIDSVLVYDIDTLNKVWDLNTVWQYEDSEGKYDHLTFFTVENQTRQFNYKWDYYYDDNNNSILEIATYYRNDNWKQRIKKESEFSEDNMKINQMTSYWNDEKGWVPSKFFENEYNPDGSISNIINYNVSPEGSLSQVSIDYFTYENALLMEVSSYRIADESIYSLAKYIYNSDDQLTETRYFVPDTEIPDNLIPTRKFLYTYDEYGLRNELLKQNWNGEEWLNDLRYEYYRHIDNAKKVSICFNGHTQCISINALPALLRNGASLGTCDQEKRENFKTIKEDRNRELHENRKSIKVYPNPATDQITINLINNNSSELHKVRIEILDSRGRSLRSFKANNVGEFTFHRGDLHKGQYIVRLTDGNESFSSYFIFK